VKNATLSLKHLLNIQSLIILALIDADCHNYVQHAKCHYTECCGAQCRNIRTTKVAEAGRLEK
jgi:hypothetical protein